MIADFYKTFHKRITDTSDNGGKFSGERCLGIDPASGKKVFVKIGRFGPVAQIGETESDEKPRFAGLRKDQHIETVTLDDVLGLFAFPRELGMFEGSDVQVAIGRFGPYIKHKSLFVSIPKTDSPSEISLEHAIELIEAKRNAEVNKTVAVFKDDMKVLRGRFGIYISYKNANYKIPKTYDSEHLTYEDCLKIVADPENASKGRRSSVAAKTASKTKSSAKKK